MRTSTKVGPRLRCGLGNRLFQTMAAIGEAERRNGTPVFFLPRSSQEHGGFELLLQLFPNIPILETAPSWQEIDESFQSLEAQGTQGAQHTNDLIILKGFFQDTKFFPESSKYLPVLPTPNPNPAQPPKQPQETWSIHFRFGDYQKLPHYHVDLARYYFYTIQKIPKGSTITLFSDSPDKLPAIAKEVESFGYRVKIFENQDILETLQAFASTSVNAICSNSTFAWWASYFAWRANPQFTAYFPNRWLVGQPPPNLNHPFTQFLDLESADILASPRLLSFSHS